MACGFFCKYLRSPCGSARAMKRWISYSGVRTMVSPKKALLNLEKLMLVPFGSHFVIE